MRIEERLTAALRDEAEARDVDVTRLWAATRDRLAEEPATRRRRAPVLAAAAVVAVVTGIVGVSWLDWTADPGPSSPGGRVPAVEGGVDDEFTCPDQVSHDWARPESRKDDYYVPSLQGGPAAQANLYEAARYEYLELGDRALLRFGNADGTLAMATEFRDRGATWLPIRTDVCTGRDGSLLVPTEDAWELGLHAARPYPAGDMVWRSQGGPVLVDDRRYYDGTGLVRHRSIYAYVCGRRMCLTSGNPTSRINGELRGGVRPHDATSMFMLPDEMVSRSHPYGMWVLYDADRAVKGLSVRLRGQEGLVRAESFHAEGWPGRLYVVLAPFDEVQDLTVTLRDSDTARYRPEELPGYDGP